MFVIMERLCSLCISIYGSAAAAAVARLKTRLERINSSQLRSEIWNYMKTHL